MTNRLDDTDVHNPLLTDSDREALSAELDQAMADLQRAAGDQEQTLLWWQAEQTRRHVLRQFIAGRRLRFIEEDISEPFYIDPPER